MSTHANASAASAETLAANFQIAELEPRLENSWLMAPIEPTVPGGGGEGGGQGNGG